MEHSPFRNHDDDDDMVGDPKGGGFDRTGGGKDDDDDDMVGDPKGGGFEKPAG